MLLAPGTIFAIDASQSSGDRSADICALSASMISARCRCRKSRTSLGFVRRPGLTFPAPAVRRPTMRSVPAWHCAARRPGGCRHHLFDERNDLADRDVGSPAESIEDNLFGSSHFTHRDDDRATVSVSWTPSTGPRFNPLWPPGGWNARSSALSRGRAWRSTPPISKDRSGPGIASAASSTSGRPPPSRPSRRCGETSRPAEGLGGGRRAGSSDRYPLSKIHPAAVDVPLIGIDPDCRLLGKNDDSRTRSIHCI
jgi:hypothetical protein